MTLRTFEAGTVVRSVRTLQLSSLSSPLLVGGVGRFIAAAGADAAVKGSFGVSDILSLMKASAVAVNSSMGALSASATDLLGSAESIIVVTLFVALPLSTITVGPNNYLWCEIKLTRLAATRLFPSRHANDTEKRDIDIFHDH